VDRGTGATFIVGALDERYATPLLAELSRTESGEPREIAIFLLMRQATPEALQAVRELSPDGLSQRARTSRKTLLEKPPLITPRPSPKITRQQYIAAFEALVAGDSRPFDELVDKVPDGERDVVAVCTSADLDLIRKVRRSYAARGNQHALEYYDVFSQILLTFVWRDTETTRAAR
jgi:hypothetical protein